MPSVKHQFGKDGGLADVDRRSRGAEGDLAEAQAAIDWSANLRADQDSAMRDIWLLRLRVLLCRARSDEIGYRDYRDCYRDMAKSLGFEGHIDWAEAMIEGT